MNYVQKLMFFFLCLGVCDGQELRVTRVTFSNDIPKAQAKQILVDSFVEQYRDVPLSDLNPLFQTREDVIHFYEDYFDSELQHFEIGELLWMQAWMGDELVGWATFEKMDGNEVYMNLIAVAPSYQRRGVGKALTFSTNAEKINLLLRKVNSGGRKFYEAIGFHESNFVRPDNFVDNSLLTGFSYP